jgi:sarcosine oxidase subunit alpha
MMSSKKDFIGRILAARDGLADPARPTLVGVKPVDRKARIFAGAHLLLREVDAIAKNDRGYLTSVAFSPMLGHWIGLGVLARGLQRVGECIRAHDALRGSDVDVEVVSPVFYDPEGVRLKG